MNYYFVTILLIFYLIIDNPFFIIKNWFNKLFVKSLKILIIVLMIYDLYFLLSNKTGIVNDLISGALLFGLVLVYMISGEHSGIEDKVARKVFKMITWFFLWLILLMKLIIS